MCQIHLFSDMIVVLKKGEGKQLEMWKKIVLDEYSYVIEKEHLKYFKYMVMICG